MRLAKARTGLAAVATRPVLDRRQLGWLTKIALLHIGLCDKVLGSWAGSG
jgi:hypothetical protein